MAKFISILFCIVFMAAIALQVFGVPEPQLGQGSHQGHGGNKHEHGGSHGGSQQHGGSHQHGSGHHDGHNHGYQTHGY